MTKFIIGAISSQFRTNEQTRNRKKEREGPANSIIYNNGYNNNNKQKNNVKYRDGGIVRAANKRVNNNTRKVEKIKKQRPKPRWPTFFDCVTTFF